MFRIWLFGSVSIAHGDARAAAVSGRCGSLLAYLALGQHRYFSRSELIASLWPERDCSATAGSFNTALWRLRRLVERPPLGHGDLIVCDRRGAIGLDGPVETWLDLAEFARCIAPGLSKPPEQLRDDEIEGLRRGVALYRSDILMDLADDWALREREKHRRSYLNALGRLMQIATIRRDYADGIRHAQAILDNDALREDVHRELMHLFVLNGQRAHALCQFERCRDMLRRELAIQPMRETLALYQRITDGAVGITADTALPVTPQTFYTRADSAGQHAQLLIENARRGLAAADAQLQLSLQFLER
ncbi:AfsR/SARP family transcriptional regulator [Xanthomonas hortorum]|uniref:Response regulator receiver protein n=1 Tax=Xanthomonas hortorum TaxID=56454 RepID=A0AA47ETX6_9XANT|nr:BTAD domain-containing putative transcriptional regulator [Xanthomonas hortorum]WAH65276.1 response regulator receiver protein [Xanthomonas hortorum]